MSQVQFFKGNATFKRRFAHKVKVVAQVYPFQVGTVVKGSVFDFCNCLRQHDFYNVGPAESAVRNFRKTFLKNDFGRHVIVTYKSFDVRSLYVQGLDLFKVFPLYLSHGKSSQCCADGNFGEVFVDGCYFVFLPVFRYLISNAVNGQFAEGKQRCKGRSACDYAHQKQRHHHDGKNTQFFVDGVPHVAKTAYDKGRKGGKNFPRNQKYEKGSNGIAESEPDDGQSFFRRENEGKGKSENTEKHSENDGENSVNFQVGVGIHLFAAAFAVQTSAHHKVVVVLFPRFNEFRLLGLEVRLQRRSSPGVVVVPVVPGTIVICLRLGVVYFLPYLLVGVVLIRGVVGNFVHKAEFCRGKTVLFEAFCKVVVHESNDAVFCPC